MNPYLQWWGRLSTRWKDAFAEAFFHHSNEPAPEELATLYQSPTLRLAGPSAAYPNLSFELTDLSGIAGLPHLRVLVVVHHQVESITELAGLYGLTGLFLFNNRIKSLSGMEGLVNLTQLYVQNNSIESIQPVAGLPALKELYIHDNLINSLEGLTEGHADSLQTLICKPNDLLKQKELLRVERELGIRCRSV